MARRSGGTDDGLSGAIAAITEQRETLMAQVERLDRALAALGNETGNLRVGARRASVGRGRRGGPRGKRGDGPTQRDKVLELVKAAKGNISRQDILSGFSKPKHASIGVLLTNLKKQKVIESPERGVFRLAK